MTEASDDPKTLETSSAAAKASLPAPNRAQVETVSFDSLSRALPAPKASTYLEWSGVRQMNILLGGICVMVAVFFLGWVSTRPGLEQAEKLLTASRGTGGSPQVTEVPVEDFAKILGDLRKDHFERFRDMFQLIVVGALVPLFTLLAGYVFGRGQKPPDGSAE